MMEDKRIGTLWCWTAALLLIIAGTTPGAAQQQNNSSGSAESPSWCSGPSRFYCFLSNRCLPAYRKCDYNNDCENGEDEIDCPGPSTPSLNHGCNLNQYACNTTTAGSVTCIDAEWLCDGQTDCPSGDDEVDCAPIACAEGQYRCLNTTHNCISGNWRCDGENDCLLGDDESDCGITKCLADEIFCSSDSKCLPNRWICDGERDCESGEDENNCTHRTTETPQHQDQCTPLEFQCASGNPRCIVEAWKCDGEADCIDGSDEERCSEYATECTNSEFKCEADDKCIPAFLTCSGKNECSDGADEKLERCAGNSTVYCDLSKAQFSCGGRSDKCITLDQVCDGKKDCQSNRDENVNIFCGSDPPSDLCENTQARCGIDPLIRCENIRTANQNRIVGFVCQCPSGYSHIDQVCTDNDECQNTESPVCDHLCTNEVGGYRCVCNLGYLLEQDGRSCKVQEGNVTARLIFATGDTIRSAKIRGEKEMTTINANTRAVALDYDFSRRVLFSFDLRSRRLLTTNLTLTEDGIISQGIDQQVFGVDTVNGLAFDWVYRNLYWADAARNTISMATIDVNSRLNQSIVLYQNQFPNCTSNHSADVHTGDGKVCINEPRAVAVHPQKGWVLWSDWGNNPHIALGAMDGSHMEMIAYNTDNAHSYLQWPNGLTLDLSSENERLYWIDARLHSLFTCTIDRCVSDIRIVLYDTERIKHPYSISVFENTLYWSDWAKRYIASVNKYTGGNFTVFLADQTQPMGLKVYHPMAQVQSLNHCQVDDGEEAQCEHICVPRPWSRQVKSEDFRSVPNDQAQYACLCMEGFRLKANGKSCTNEPEIPEEKKNCTTHRYGV